jgi:hypothetical protein
MLSDLGWATSGLVPRSPPANTAAEQSAAINRETRS